MMPTVQAREVAVGKDRDSPGNPDEQAPPRGPESRGTPAAEPSAAERRARALRDNLHRRKAQARIRKAGPGGESPPGS